MWNSPSKLSRFLSILLFIGIIPLLSFYIGVEYNKTNSLLNTLPLTENASIIKTNRNLVSQTENSSPDELSADIVYNIGDYTFNYGSDFSVSFLNPEEDYRTIHTDYSITTNPPETKVFSNGIIMVKDGPYESYTVGDMSQCGACARGNFNMYLFDFNKGTSTNAFTYFDVYDENDTDFSLSSDWKTIKYYELVPSANDDNLYDPSTNIWKETDYCFNDKSDMYEECGTKNNVQPPSPRNFKPDLNG